MSTIRVVNAQYALARAHHTYCTTLVGQPGITNECSLAKAVLLAQQETRLEHVGLASTLLYAYQHCSMMTVASAQQLETFVGKEVCVYWPADETWYAAIVVRVVDGTVKLYYHNTEEVETVSLAEVLPCGHIVCA
jgi:hypothetical protein